MEHTMRLDIKAENSAVIWVNLWMLNSIEKKKVIKQNYLLISDIMLEISNDSSCVEWDQLANTWESFFPGALFPEILEKTSPLCTFRALMCFVLKTALKEDVV